MAMIIKQRWSPKKDLNHGRWLQGWPTGDVSLGNWNFIMVSLNHNLFHLNCLICPLKSHVTKSQSFDKKSSMTLILRSSSANLSLSLTGIEDRIISGAKSDAMALVRI